MRGTSPGPTANRQAAPSNASLPRAAIPRSGPVSFGPYTAAAWRNRNAAHPRRWRHLGRIDRDFRIEAAAYQIQKFREPFAGHLVEFRLPAEPLPCQAFSPAAFYSVFAILQPVEQRLHKRNRSGHGTACRPCNSGGATAGFSSRSISVAKPCNSLSCSAKGRPWLSTAAGQE